MTKFVCKRQTSTIGFWISSHWLGSILVFQILILVRCFHNTGW